MGVLAPLLQSVEVMSSADRMRVNQANQVKLRSEIGHVHQPIPDVLLRNGLHVHLFKTRLQAEMQNGKGPNLLAFAALIAIDTRWSHAGIAGEVVGHNAIFLQPSGDPRWLIP